MRIGYSVLIPAILALAACGPDTAGPDATNTTGTTKEHALVQLAEARLHELLPLECSLVLRVFPEVAHFDRGRNRLRQRHVQFVAELFDLQAQLFLHFS